MLRRLAALLLLFVTFGSNAESVVGVLRDGEVHHESPMAAAQHVADGAGNHGHEDAAASGTDHGGSQHDHGTSADHCTHTHSAALLPVFALELPTRELSVDFTEPAVHLARTSYPLFHPPKP